MSLKQIIRNKFKSYYKEIGKDIDVTDYSDIIKTLEKHITHD